MTIVAWCEKCLDYTTQEVLEEKTETLDDDIVIVHCTQCYGCEDECEHVTF